MSDNAELRSAPADTNPLCNKRGSGTAPLNSVRARRPAPLSPSLNPHHADDGDDSVARSVTEHLSPSLRQHLRQTSAVLQGRQGGTAQPSAAAGRAKNGTAATIEAASDNSHGDDDDDAVESVTEAVDALPCPVTPDSTSSAIATPQWRRNDPYATSPGQSVQLEGGAAPFTANVPPGSTAVYGSQLNVVLHTGGSSARVSRTTSMVKTSNNVSGNAYNNGMAEARVSRTTSMTAAADARVTRTTSMMTASDTRVSRTTSLAATYNLATPVSGGAMSPAGYRPQLPSFSAGMAGGGVGSERVSRTTSMAKNSDPAAGPMHSLRFSVSASSSAQVSRTTSMVKTASVLHTQGATISPLLKTSPQSSRGNVFGASNAMPAMDGRYSATHRGVSSSPSQMPEVEGAEESITSSTAYGHPPALQFNAAQYSGPMTRYHSSDMCAHESGEEYDDDMPSIPSSMHQHMHQQQQHQQPGAQYHQHHSSSSSRRESGTQYVGGDALPQTPGHNTYTHRRTFESAFDEGGANGPLFTPLTSYTNSLSPGTLADVSRSPPQRQHALPQAMYQAATDRAYGEQSAGVHGSTTSFQTSSTVTPPHVNASGTNDARGFAPRPASSALSQQQQQQQQSHHHHDPFPTERYAGSAGEAAEGDDGTAVEAAGGSGSHQHSEGDNVESMEAVPNDLMRTQPPRSPQDTSPRALEATDSSSSHQVIPGFTVADLTAMLEEAKQAAEKGGEAEVWCPYGSQFSVYDAGMREHYTISSEEVALTRGAIKYVALFDRYGNQTRFRFQLCNRYLHHRCTSGVECPYIHSHVLSKSTQVHINENNITTPGVRKPSAEDLAGGRNTANYPTIPAGMVFAVYPPNQLNSAPQLIPSEFILVTDGAQQTSRALASCEAEKQRSKGSQGQPYQPAPRSSSSPEVAIVRPRHCAHFQFKRMCNLGSSCHFIHSLVPFVQGMLNQPTLPAAAKYVTVEERSAGFVLPTLPSTETQPSLPGPKTHQQQQQQQQQQAWPQAGSGTPHGAESPILSMTNSAVAFNPLASGGYAVSPGVAVSTDCLQSSSSGNYAPYPNTGGFVATAVAAPYEVMQTGYAAGVGAYGVRQGNCVPAMPSFAIPSHLPPQPYVNAQHYMMMPQQESSGVQDPYDQQQQGSFLSDRASGYGPETHGSPHQYAVYGAAPMAAMPTGAMPHQQQQQQQQQWASYNGNYY